MYLFATHTIYFFNQGTAPCSGSAIRVVSTDLVTNSLNGNLTFSLKQISNHCNLLVPLANYIFNIFT